MDNGCSKCMTGKVKYFFTLKAYEEDSVFFGDSMKGYILGISKVGNNLSQSFANVHYMDGLKYTFLRVAKICNIVNEVRFMANKCVVTSIKDVQITIISWRIKNMHVVDLGSCNFKDLICLSV